MGVVRELWLVQKKGSKQSGVSSYECEARGIQLVPGAVALPDCRWRGKEICSVAGSC